MHKAYVNIGDVPVPTQIITWGKWIEESDDVKEVVICITGNPGLSGFYQEFSSVIYNSLESKIPVWVIGHAGHDHPPSSSLRQMPSLHDNEQCFNLSGQIKHKIDFIESYVPKNAKIHLIGHSIGAWMILELLKHQPIKDRILKTYLLFPTIERMATSSNGKIFTKILTPIEPILLFLVKLVYKLPVFIKVFLIYIYFWINTIPNFFTGTVVKYINPVVIEKVLFLAKDEMITVTSLDADHVKNNKKLLKFYYGTTDGWVPIKYFNQIKEKNPDLDATLDDNNISHAFVLKSSNSMGQLVADWIREYSIDLNC